MLYCLSALLLCCWSNLPARRVLVRDLKRFDDGMSRLLPVMEVNKCLEELVVLDTTLWEAWLACKGGDPRQMADEIADRYIHGPVEHNFQISAEPAMRFHLLSSIATGGLQTRRAMESSLVHILVTLNQFLSKKQLTLC